jgi:hypothetical protein
VRAQYRPDVLFEKTGITSVAGFFPMSEDLQNELPLMKAYVQSNLGRALLPHTNTMLFMRFIANDGQENLLWSLSFDTEIAKQKFGALEAQSAEDVVRELVRRVQASGCSPGKHCSRKR